MNGFSIQFDLSGKEMVRSVLIGLSYHRSLRLFFFLLFLPFFFTWILNYTRFGEGSTLNVFMTTHGSLLLVPCVFLLVMIMAGILGAAININARSANCCGVIYEFDINGLTRALADGKRFRRDWKELTLYLEREDLLIMCFGKNRAIVHVVPRRCLNENQLFFIRKLATDK